MERTEGKMDVNDSNNRKVQVHDRRCPKRPCYHPMLMAMVGSEDIYQCLGWDGNEEPCPNKMDKEAFYCGDCGNIAIAINCNANKKYHDCNKYWKILRIDGKRILKCQACLQNERLKFFNRDMW
jgi:hypothetical protein